MDEMRYQLNLLTAMNKKLGGQEKMYRLVCESAAVGFLYFSFEENRIQCLGSWNKYFDFDVTQTKDLEQIFELAEKEHADKLRDVIFLEKRAGEKGSTECYFESMQKWYRFETRLFFDERGKVTDKIVLVHDVTERKKQTLLLENMAYYDMATGLYNRNYFVMNLGKYLRRAEEENATVSVLFIDIDDFKKINDGMGMVIGESLLEAFSNLLKEVPGDNIIASHFASDLFCLAIYDPCGATSVENIYRYIKDKTNEGLLVADGQRIRITFCMGVAEYPEASKDALRLINCAEIVMFKAKAFGKNTIKYYDTPIINEFMQNIEVENRLKKVVFDKEFALRFQPQYFAGTKKLRGVEALLRWFPANEKPVSPAVFIPAAERNGMIVSIGKWVVEESMRCYAMWREKYDYPMTLSINISAIQCKQADFVSHLMQTIDKYDIDKKLLELEITETVLIQDFDDVIKKLDMLREYGIKVSLDDFGTGYSSLSYLKGMPIDTLKIDKCFVDTVLTDDSTRIIMESIINMVKRLGYETIAEGVEEKEQFEYLKSIGCDMIQGYYLGKPMASEDIMQLLEEIC